MTAATVLTIGRLALAPVFCVLLLREDARSLWVAAALFAIAALTDNVDGWLARRTGTVTPVGRVLDPLADKLLVALALLAFVRLDVSGVELWMVGAILAREVLVMWLRGAAGRRGVAVPVSPLAKWKTTVQMAFVAAVLALMCYRATRDPAPAFWKQPGNGARGVEIALLLTMLITVLSGLDYFWRTRGALAARSPR
jgi:CDP-diacylglycerol--glycerol-3-phosphate 3-phosphatidyltransferase